MILVTGASGQFGKNAVDHLLRKGTNPAEIAILVRDREKAKSFEHTGVEVRVGGLYRLRFLTACFQRGKQTTISFQ